MATVAEDILLRVEGESDDAVGSMAALAAVLESVDGRDVTIDVKTRGVSTTIAELEAVVLQLERLDGKTANTSVEVETHRDRDMGGAALAAGTRAATNAAGAAASVGTSVFSAVAEAAVQAGRSVGGFGGGIVATMGSLASMGPIALAVAAALAVLSAAFIAVAAAIATAVVGALAALVASMAAAAAGAAVLGTALLAALGPAVGLAIGVVMRFTKILEALKAKQDAAAQSERKNAQETKARAERIRAANEQQRNAAIALDRANQNLKSSTVDAYRAMEDAAEAASDAILGVEDAQLGLAESKLGVEEAELALKQFKREARTSSQEIDKAFTKFSDVHVRFDSSTLAGATPGMNEGDRLKLQRLILNVRRAKLGEKQATDGLSDAERNLSRARQNNAKFQEQGILAYAGYKSAVQGVEDAERGLASATRKVKQAHDQASGSIENAKAKAEQLMNDLTPMERKFAQTFQRMRAAASKAFGPAVGNVFKGLIQSAKTLPSFFNTLKAPMAGLGNAWGKVIQRFSQALVTPESRAAIKDIVNGATRLATITGRGAINLFRIIRNVAVAAMPHLVRLSREFVGWLGRIAGKTQNARTMRSVIGGLVGHFRTWLQFGKSVARVIGAFFSIASGKGRSLADDMTRVLNRFADWLNTREGRQKVREFLQRCVDLVRDIARRLPGLAKRFGNAMKDITPHVKNLLKVLDKMIAAADKLNKGKNWILGTVKSTQPARGGAGEEGAEVIRRGQRRDRRRGRAKTSVSIPGVRVPPVPGAWTPAPATAGASSSEFNIHVPAAPGREDPDARILGAEIAREIKRRGN